MHISIKVLRVGYFSHAMLPNEFGLWEERISSMTQAFQYKLPIANKGGVYLKQNIIYNVVEYIKKLNNRQNSSY